MDTHIKFVKEDGTIKSFGACDLGFENLMFKVFDILIRFALDEEVYQSERTFLNFNIKEYKASDIEEYEAIIDAKHKLFYYLNGFVIYDLDKTTIKEETGLEDDEIFFLETDHEDLFLKKKMSFDEFKILYDMLKLAFKEKAVVINNKYLYLPEIKL